MQVSLWDKPITDWVAELRRTLTDTAVHVESDYSRAMIDVIVYGKLLPQLQHTPLSMGLSNITIAYLRQPPPPV